MPHPRPPTFVGDSPHHFPGPGTLDRALALVRYLRSKCPWDAKQTAESLIPHLLEETHEVVEAIREGDARELEGELGDLLLNLAFQVVVAEEGGSMDAESIYRRLEAKMIARHPHVFGDAEHRNWEESKAAERPDDEGVLSGLARGLDPLTKAYRIQERVAGVGFDWADHQGALEKVREELEEVIEALEERDTGDEPPRAPDSKGGALGPSQQARASDNQLSAAVQEEMGDLLFAVVNLARLTGVHPANALARANAKFTGRFERLEKRAHAQGLDLSAAGLERLDEIWNDVKREE